MEGRGGVMSPRTNGEGVAAVFDLESLPVTFRPLFIHTVGSFCVSSSPSKYLVGSHVFPPI